MYCMEKAAVKMGNVIKKMSDHVPESFFRLNVFLAAFMAKTSYHSNTAIQAILLLSMGNMGHCNFFLKISNIGMPYFDLLNVANTCQVWHTFSIN